MLFIITVFLYLQTITNNKSKLPVRVVRESIEEKKVILVLWTASIFLFWRKWPASLILHRVPGILCLGTSQLSKQGLWAAQMDRVHSMDSLLPQPCVCTSLLAPSAVPSYHLTYWISKYTLLHNHSYNQMKIFWKITLHFCCHHPLYIENLAIASIMFPIATVFSAVGLIWDHVLHSVSVSLWFFFNKKEFIILYFLRFFRTTNQVSSRMPLNSALYDISGRQFWLSYNITWEGSWRQISSLLGVVLILITYCNICCLFPLGYCFCLCK